MKAKRIIKGIGITLFCLILAAAIAVGVFFVTYKATVSFDFSQKTGAVMKGASGYLYGIAENGVPSAEMVESLDIQTVSQKVAGGLQHPTGDIDAASPMLTQAKYEVVYLQDIYDTWYYLHDEIMEQRSKGTYDWQALLNDDYLPKVEKMAKALSEKPYADKLVYCLYNECDNGIWFGESQKDDNPDNAYGVWCDYNDTGKANFNAAWKQTYETVRRVHPDALIGGPGFCDYNKDKLKVFLTFCKEQNCLPDVMIYHELAADEAYFFDEHIREYRALEQELGIGELPVIITEYGTTGENGYPGAMAQYIAQFETNKVYGDNAYWRLADNLNDNCADADMPNAQWWLMRWYTDMKGETVRATNKDILSSNFRNYFKYDLDELSFNGFTGIASVSDDGREIAVVCGGGDRKSRVQLKHLDSTALYGKEVVITVEETVYRGLYGAVTKPHVIRSYTKKLGKSETVDLGKTDKANAYHITVREGSEVPQTPASERVEFENGTLLGDAYTYDSYCPASGGNDEGHDLVGGMEKEGDGVKITFEAPAGDRYTLDIIYGNSNDGPWGENGRQNPDDRADTAVKLTLDGEEETLLLPSTIKSEYTSCYSLQKELSKGSHTLQIQHLQGTCVLDSLVVTPQAYTDEIALLPDEDRTKDGTVSTLAVAPENGYYTVQADAETLTVGGATVPVDGTVTVYLKRGLNYLDFQADGAVSPQVKKAEQPLQEIGAETLALSDGAVLGEIGGEAYIGGISCNGGEAALTVTAEADGVYALTVRYSNNEEGGVHDYNVDLIERYVTVGVNGKKADNLWCRSTYSWTTQNTATLFISLKKGKNTVTLTNDGAVKFNGRDTFAPYIFGVSAQPVFP